MQSERGTLRDKIISETLRRTGVSEALFFGPTNPYHVVDARIEVVRELVAEGFSNRAIARIMKRTEKAIRNYRRHSGQRRVSGQRLLPIHVSCETRNLIDEIAKAEGVEATTLVKQWIGERVHYEAEAKARAA